MITHLDKILSLTPEKCVCYDPKETMFCVCPDVEKVVRWVMSQDHDTLTPEMREECIEEIVSVEGYTREECENLSDPDLARTVIYAWTDYVRDKGLL